MKPPVLRSSASVHEAAGFPPFGFAPGGIVGP
ncbi:hypothetical protein B2K_40155 [Paenibacillus mucilaginosus K02]|uniref:Uncharacterized protein n=1 Tax=Paenibacillus mucilaginosus K02 TaxID=997761 RepID=R9UNE9_9BACL|nr:hypothetical protein B2K_40155 [Paenibacillus mucilaginosus K02]